MKTFFKILGIILVILALAAVILPYAFKDKIIELAKQEINNQVDAKIDFQDMDFGLIRSFPDFRLSITKLSVIGKNEFKDDTLAFIPEIRVVFNLMDVLRGNFEVSKIKLIKPQMLIWVKSDGKANYDIALSDESVVKSPAEATSTDENDLSIRLKKFSIEDGILIYRDDEMQLLMKLVGLNHTLSGDLSASRTTLFTQTSIIDLTVKMEEATYLNHASIRYQANFDADLANNIYSFGKNELSVNNLKLNFDGSVSLMNEGTNVVLSYNTPSTTFKELLSLVPSAYLKDYKGLETSGTFALNGAVKGLLTETSYPAFSLNLEVQNATVKYPELPGKITNIGLKTAISNPGGSLDLTVIDVQKMHLEMGKNPIDILLKLSTPFSDPNIDCNIKGRLELASVKDYYPIDSTDQLKGTVVADITLKGKLSSIEKEEYDQFLAMGSIVVQNMEYNSPDLKNPLEIAQAQLNFSPQYIDLVSFSMKTGKSDLQASGKLTDYLAYYLRDETLRGTLLVKSTYFNMDDLMDTSSAEDDVAASNPTTTEIAASTPDTTARVTEIPGNINFVLGSSFKQLIYDKLDMSQVNGKLIISEKILNLQSLRMEVSGGTMEVNGSYKALTPVMAETALNLKLNNLDIPTAYKQFALFRTYLPLAEKATGKFNASLDFTTGLDAEMMPVYESLNGTGSMSSNQIRVENLNTLEKAAQLLHYDELSNLTLEKVLVEFKFVNGKLVVDPFDIKTQGIKGTLQGWTALDGSIGYSMQVDLPRKKLGSDANTLIDNLVGEANKLGANFSVSDNIPFELAIGGTLENPTVSVAPGVGSGKETVKETTKEVINQEIDKVKEEAGVEAKKLIEDADAQAKKLIADAEKQADDLRKNAEKAKQDLKAEAKKQGDQLIVEGKKNGTLGEMAAKKAVAKLDEEAEKQGNDLISEADKQAKAIVNTAKTSADKIKADAQSQADKL